VNECNPQDIDSESERSGNLPTFQGSSIRYAEGGAVFGAGAAPVVGPGGRDVGVPQPFLDFAQIGAPVQGVGGRRGPQGVRPETFSVNPRRLGVLAQHAVVNGPVGERPAGVPPPRRVFQGSEERPVRVFAVAGGLEVVMDPFEGQRVGRHVAHLCAFSENTQVGHALAALKIAHPQAAEFLASQAVVKKRRQDGPVALALEGSSQNLFQIVR
jgi:hypothetical protein